jgi:hypothetical protein
MALNTQSLKLLRWTARILGTLLVIFTLLFGIGSLFEGAGKANSLTSFDASLIVTFSFWGLGLVGLVIALWREKVGGLISLISFVVFITLAFIGSKNQDPKIILVLSIFLIPAILYLIYSQAASTAQNKVSNKQAE